MKVHIQNGSRSISVEGELSEIESILERHWISSATSIDDEEPASNVNTTKPAAKKRTSTSSKKPKATVGEASGARQNIDPQALGNKLKARTDFPNLKAKILDKKSEWLQKCKLVAMIAEAPITSGDVNRFLTAFKIKSDLPTLSRTLSSNHADFMVKGANPATYELTAIAHEAFEKWLAEPNE